MPWTPAQRRLFAVQMRKGEISRKEFDRRMREGTRTDVDRTGHAKTARKSSRKKKATRKASRRKSRRRTRR